MRLIAGGVLILLGAIAFYHVIDRHSLSVLRAAFLLLRSVCVYVVKRGVLKRHFSGGGPQMRLSGPILRDTARLSQRYPPIARHGVFCVSTCPTGCDTPSPFFDRFPLGEHAKCPHKRGISAMLARYPLKTRQNTCDTPLCDTISKGYCAIWGGISHWSAKWRPQKRLRKRALRGKMLAFKERIASVSLRLPLGPRLVFTSFAFTKHGVLGSRP